MVVTELLDKPSEISRNFMGLSCAKLTEEKPIKKRRCKTKYLKINIFLFGVKGTIIS